MNKKERQENLLPAGVPRYIRIYDNGGGDRWFCRKCLKFHDERNNEHKKCPNCASNMLAAPTESFDRYTVVFGGNYAGRDGCDYLSMSERPFHPQGFGQHGNHERVIDATYGFTPKMGDKAPFGARRAPWSNLPEDCKRLVLQDYKAIWNLL